jgi:hypothetical protein
MRIISFQTMSLVCVLAAASPGCKPAEVATVDSPSTPISRRKTATWRFDQPAEDAVGGWRFEETNSQGTPATWQVTARADAPSPPNVMKLVRTDNDDGTFNLAIAERTSYGDLDLSVAVMADQGKEDQGGGPVWRCQDRDNYYICRLNPLERNFRLYRVLQTRRKQLESANVDLTSGRWYTVRITMVGRHITCYLDGRKLLEADDDTFGKAGMVGLWTKADAVTAFDDLVVTPVISPSQR